MEDLALMPLARSKGEASPIPAHVRPDLVVDIDYHALPGDNIDPQASWCAFRKASDSPVVYSPYNGGHWIATRSADIRHFMRDQENWSSSQAMIPDHGGPRIIPIEIDGKIHDEYRKIVDPYFSPAAVKNMEPSLRRLAVELIEAIRPNGECEFVAEFGLKFPVTVVLQMMGLPVEHGDWLNSLMDKFVRSAELDQRLAAYAELSAYYSEWLDKRIEEPGDDPVSAVARGEVEGRPLTREEMLSTLFNFIGGGLDSVAMLLTFVVHHLATHPEARDRLIDRLDDLNPVINEYVRRFPIASTGRILVKDIEYKGIQMKAGDRMFISTSMANLCPDLTDCPEEIVFGRDATKHLTFGVGRHMCPGITLGRVELKIFLEEWLSRIPAFRIKPDSEIDMVAATTNGLRKLSLEWPTS